MVVKKVAQLKYRFSALALLILVLSILFLGNPAPTLAHAKLFRTMPEANSLLDTSPAEIGLYLSEAVSLDFSTVTLYDRARNEQPVGPLGRIGTDDTTVRLSVGKSLPAGSYTVVWRVL